MTPATIASSEKLHSRSQVLRARSPSPRYRMAGSLLAVTRCRGVDGELLRLWRALSEQPRRGMVPEY